MPATDLKWYKNDDFIVFIHSAFECLRGMIYFGLGILNDTINKLPFELHLPTYSFCGPGTKLEERLSRGDLGINPLDSFCKEHDIAYAKNRGNIKKRNIADKILSEKAWQRVIAKDSSIGEKAAAYAITNIMKAKSKLGMGLKTNKKGKKKRKLKTKSQLDFKVVVNEAKKAIGGKVKNKKVAIQSALVSVKNFVKNNGGKDKFVVPKVMKLPKITGEGLPLIPIFAGLSALGALTGGTTAVAKAIKDAKSAKNQLEEAKRHNKVMESIALGKGLYLSPYQPFQNCKGEGISLRLHNKNVKSLKKKKRL